MAEENIFAQSDKAKKKEAAPQPQPQPSKTAAPTPYAAAPKAAPGNTAQVSKNKSNLALILILAIGIPLVIITIVAIIIIHSVTTAKALAEYEVAYGQARIANTELDSEMHTIFYNAGYSKYYSDDERTRAMHDDCLKEFGISEEVIAAMSDPIAPQTLYENGGKKGLKNGTAILNEGIAAYKQAKPQLSKCEDIVKKDISSRVQVKLGEFEVIEKSKYWTDTGMEVTVTNKDSSSHSYRITIVATDNKGKEIKKDTIYTDSIAPGKTGTYTAFDYCSDVADELKNAKFEVESIED